MPRNAQAMFILLALLAGSTAASAQSKDRLRLRVVTYNVWGLPAPLSVARSERIARIGPALAALKPDVVALQEVWIHADGKRLMKALAAAGLPHAHHRSEGLSRSGLVLASRFPIAKLRFQAYRLAGKPQHFWHGDFYARKGILVVELKTPLGPVVVADTHLHARYGSDQYEPIQLTQALQAARIVDPPQGKAPPLILAGDINSRITMRPFRLLVCRARLQPVSTKLRIDWIFSRAGSELAVQVKEVRTVFDAPVDLGGGTKRKLSDHDGVLAVLELRRRAKSLAPPRLDPKAWRQIGGEARAVLEAEARVSRTRGWAYVGVGILLGLLAAGAFGLSRKRTGWRAGALVALGVALLALAGIFASLGLVYEPSLRAGIEAALEQLPKKA